MEESSLSSSTWEDDPRGALYPLGGVIGTAVVAFGLVCWGGPVGRLLVLATVGPAPLLILLSQALFFARDAAAVRTGDPRRGRAVGARWLRRLPPPGYRGTDAVAHLDT
ncbi:MAG: hypothetical protein R2701_11830 [Acidimicrobiales bacterium]